MVNVADAFTVGIFHQCNGIKSRHHLALFFEGRFECTKALHIRCGTQLPNISSIAIIQIALSLSWAVLTEAALSFLGLGSPPPAPSLGSMIYEARTLVLIAPWTLYAPGAIIVTFVVALNLLGDSIRDILDPRSREVSS